MDDNNLKEQVELIRQVFEYIQRFKDKTFVIKLDCSIFNHSFFPILVKDLVLLHRLGIRVVLVPGAKSRIDEVLSRYNISWETVKGIRISTPKAIPFIKMAAFDVSNRLMTQLAANNTNAVIGNWVKARNIGVRDGIDYQDAGIVEKVNIAIIQSILKDGLIPIFPNIGWSSKGKPYNISSNELAFTLSSVLEAEKLFFVSNIQGIKIDKYRVPEDFTVSADGIVTQLTLKEARKFLELNRDRKGDEVLEFVSMAYRAGKEGVKRIHIVDGGIEGVILKEIFSSRGFGTMIYSNLHENIRPMIYSDIPEVLRIMQPYIGKGILVSRNEQEMMENCENFVVYEVDGLVHACGALYTHRCAQGEIAGVAVNETYRGLRIGKRIVSYLLKKAKSLNLHQVFVLTTQTADWFLKLGFKRGSVSNLPETKRALYDSNRNSQVLIYDLDLEEESEPL